MAQHADILYELRGIASVRGVHEMVSAPSPEWPRVIVEIDAFDAYQLAVVTCALIRALPDVDRGHVGVISTDRLRGVLLPRTRPLALSVAELPPAAQRAKERAAALPAMLPMRHIQIELDPFREDHGVLFFQGHALEVVRDPFRTPSPLVVIIAQDPAFRAISAQISAHAYRIDWRDAAVDLDAIEANPARLYVDERLAPDVLRWMKVARPLDFGRTFIVSDEGGRDWLEELLRSLGARGVEVVTPDEIPESLRKR